MCDIPTVQEELHGALQSTNVAVNEASFDYHLDIISKSSDFSDSVVDVAVVVSTEIMINPVSVLEVIVPSTSSFYILWFEYCLLQFYCCD
jgi:hypothetical protein